MGQERADVSRREPVGLPTEDFVYLMITLSGITVLVLEAHWGWLAVWVVASTTAMLRIETNSRKIR